MPDIFISYSRKDSEQALQLAERLQGEGMSVWIDQRGIEAAKTWSEEIVNAIEGSRAFVLLLSSHSIESDNVAKELSIAFESKRTLVPVAIEDVALPAKFKYQLSGIQRVAYSQHEAIRRALITSGVSAAKSSTLLHSARKSLMILPFEDLSPTGDNGWFADGLTSELILAMSSIRSLLVIDWNTSKLFKERKVKTIDLARELNVRYFIEGQVRKFGDQLKITVTLLDIESGDHVWQDALKGTMQDVFEMQERVASSIVASLRIHLDDEEEKKIKERGTENVEAYELLLKAWEAIDARTREAGDVAIEYLTRAIELDPSFAHARRSKANQLANKFRRYVRDPNLLSEAESHAKEALRLRPDLLIVYSTLANIYLLKGELELAESTAREYTRLDPDNAESHYALGDLYLYMHKPELAIQSLLKAIELGDEAVTTYNNAMLTYGQLGDAQNGAVMAARLIPLLERRLRLVPGDEFVMESLLNAYTRANLPQKANETLAALTARPDLDPVTRYNLACVYARKGEHDKALVELGSAITAGFSNYEWASHDVDLVSLQPIEEFQALMTALKMKQVASQPL